MHYLPQNTVQKEAAGKPPPLNVLASSSPAYLQAGAPSCVAMVFGSAGSFTYTEQRTVGFWRLAFEIDALQPPPAVTGALAVLPVVGHHATWPAAGAHAAPPTNCVTLALYLTESAKYASSAVTRLRRSDFIEAMYALPFVFANFGIAMAAKMPMMTTTISSSMSVKPLRFMRCLPRWKS